MYILILLLPILFIYWIIKTIRIIILSKEYFKEKKRLRELEEKLGKR